VLLHSTRVIPLTEFFGRSVVALKLAAESREFMSSVAAIALAIETSLRACGKLIIAGNGGSAADAQHLAAEFLSRFLVERRPLPALALTTDTSVLTAIGNDYGFEHLFERQLRGLGRPGDAFLAISTSGRSPNILRALTAARELGLVTMGFSGADSIEMRGLCHHFLAAPSRETAIIQQIHIVAGHAICALVERAVLCESGDAAAGGPSSAQIAVTSRTTVRGARSLSGAD
jgi:D-sedoheptulose 7-phosphate isomerase